MKSTRKECEINKEGMGSQQGRSMKSVKSTRKGVRSAKERV